MAQQNYDDQNGGYISTDPYAGSSGAGGSGGDLSQLDPWTGPWDGGITGNGADPRSTTAATPTAGTGSPYSGDPTNVDTWLDWLATQPGHDPILDTPQGKGYYKQRIGETGGLNANNLSYWQNKGTLAANGGAVGAPEGGNGGFGGSWNHAPTLADLQNNPTLQWGIDQASKKAWQQQAAQGTALNGGAAKDVGEYVGNYILNNAYFPTWAAQNQSNNGNLQNLYNLGQLGFNASSFGPNSPS